MTEGKSYVSYRQKAVITPKELKQRLQKSEGKDLLVLDVREPEEYSDWRIEGSVNIPLARVFRPETLKKLQKVDEVITICAHGIRSANAAKFLRQSGINAASLYKGMSGWNSVYDVARIPTPENNYSLLQIRRLGKGCTSYMVSSAGDGAVIDPTVHIEECISLAKTGKTRIRHVMDTHLHADHVSGARALAEATGATLHLNPLEPYKSNGYASLKDGQKIMLAKTEIEVIHTPGHTKGSTSFLIAGEYLLTGDTLFVEGLARPDLHRQAEAFVRGLYRTYRSLLHRLGGDVVILPAHYSSQVPIEFEKPFSSTLSELRRRLHQLEAVEKDFLEHVLGNIPPKPPSYERILEINRKGMAYDLEEVEGLEEGPNRCALRA